MKIGILGGTFDPIHKGHLSIAKAACDQFALDKIYFVPAAVPPHKETATVVATPEERLDMVRLATSGEEDFEVSDIELRRQGPSYTVDTLEAFRTKHPDDELFLIMGADSLPQIPTWKKPQRIRELAHFLVAPRQGYSPEHEETNVQFIEMEQVPIAATEIRESTGSDDNKLSPMLPDRVLNYIRKHNLYADIK